MSKCTSINKVQNPRFGDGLLQVTIDNDVTAYWFYDYTEALAFLDQEVIVDYRQELLNGKIEQFINTFVLPVKVSTIDKKDNIKLFVDQEDNQSNVSFREIENGDNSYGCIVYCSSQEFKTSKNAVWMELVIRDRLMHVAKLRIFDYENKDVTLAGHYIRCDLFKNQYGFQTNIAVVADLDVRPNAEIAIAKQFVKNYFASDVVASDFIVRAKLMESLDEVIDYEKGYAVVRLATELSLVDAMQNISQDVNLETLGRVILTSYGHYTRKSKLSSSVNNVILSQQFQFSDKIAIAQCLDECLEEHPQEYLVWKQIQKLTETILSIRKGDLN